MLPGFPSAGKISTRSNASRDAPFTPCVIGPVGRGKGLGPVNVIGELPLLPSGAGLCEPDKAARLGAVGEAELSGGFCGVVIVIVVMGFLHGG